MPQSKKDFNDTAIRTNRTYKKAWKCWRAASKGVDRFLMILSLLVLLLGMYTIYDTLYFLDLYPTDLNYYFEGSKEDWDALPDNAAGWLTIYDTHIDYPVMQGEDNKEYLNKDAFGEFALTGSIFLDFRNDPDWGDDYNLLYGHHMSRNRMFGSLDYFEEESYFDAHTEGLLKTRGADYDLHIFAVMKDSATLPLIFDVGEEGHESEEICSYLKDHSIIYREPDGDKILAMSTCQSTGSTERLIVFATMHTVKEPGTLYDSTDTLDPELFPDP